MIEAIKPPLARYLNSMNMRSVIYVLLCLLSLAPSPVQGQERKVMRRPYIDQRRFHWGFMFGVHMQDMEFRNNGYIDPETGEQWYTDVDNYNPGFSVGVLGEMRLNKTLALRLTPTLHFGQRHLVFHEQISGRDSTQNLKSTYISVPILLKISGPRYNNFRPYLVTGFAPSIDLSKHDHDAISTKAFDCFFEIGAGCDIYLGFFKLIPELKFSFGMLDVLKKNRDDLQDNSLIRYTNSVDKAHSKMVTLTLYFE